MLRPRNERFIAPLSRGTRSAFGRPFHEFTVLEELSNGLLMFAMAFCSENHDRAYGSERTIDGRTSRAVEDLGACDAPLGPAAPFYAPPALQGIFINPFFFGDGGVLALWSVLVDPDFRLPVGTHLAVEAWASRGDAEGFRLGRTMCGERACQDA